MQVLMKSGLLAEIGCANLYGCAHPILAICAHFMWICTLAHPIRGETGLGPKEDNYDPNGRATIRRLH